MGQPKPTQDQPSMDEILSSIRRIIDKNDEPARHEPPVMPVFDPPPPQAVNDPGQPPVVAVERPPLSRDDLDSFADAIDARAATPAEDEAPAAPTPAVEPRQDKYPARFTEDDSRAFARVASALAATTGVPAKPHSAATAPGNSAARPMDDTAKRAVNDQAPDIVPAGVTLPTHAPKPASAKSAPARPAPSDAQRQPAPRQVRPDPAKAAGTDHAAKTPTRGLNETAIARPAPKREVSAESAALTPLISARAQQSVGHSFDALSETLQAKAGRDLAEMAEEMLRPMLSDWLDNNLPSIVERLVRSEIERIARGEPRAG